jgi:hypothetical protein
MKDSCATPLKAAQLSVRQYLHMAAETAQLECPIWKDYAIIIITSIVDSQRTGWIRVDVLRLWTAQRFTPRSDFEWSARFRPETRPLHSRHRVIGLLHFWLVKRESVTTTVCRSRSVFEVAKNTIRHGTCKHITDTDDHLVPGRWSEAWKRVKYRINLLKLCTESHIL